MTKQLVELDHESVKHITDEMKLLVKFNRWSVFRRYIKIAFKYLVEAFQLLFHRKHNFGRLIYEDWGKITCKVCTDFKIDILKDNLKFMHFDVSWNQDFGCCYVVDGLNIKSTKEIEEVDCPRCVLDIFHQLNVDDIEKYPQFTKRYHYWKKVIEAY